jgi:peptide/nickel transport system ATP-binding protein
MNAISPGDPIEGPRNVGATLGVQSVSYRYARRRLFRRPAEDQPLVLNNVSLQVRSGETVALVGESGSGKSTLARAIAGLLPLTQGGISLGGSDISIPVERRSKGLQRSIQIIFQNPDASLNGRHRIGTILARPLRHFFGLKGEAVHSEVRALLQAVRLPQDFATRFPSEISGGERQRVAIARALAAKPSLLLCDEIVSALDVSVQAAILDLLADIQRRTHLTMLFITHDLAVVRWFANRVVVLYRGQMCETAPAAALFAPPYHPYTALLLEAVPQFGRRAVPVSRPAVAEALLATNGCAFAGTCRYAIADRCRTVAPPWRAVGRDHAIRCHLEPAALAAIEPAALATIESRSPEFS